MSDSESHLEGSGDETGDESGAETHASTESPDEGTELDELARRAKKDPTPQALDPLWRGTMNLDRWFFAGVGKFPHMRPFSGYIDEEPYVMAFTTRARAEKYARIQNLAKEDEKPSVMSFPVVEAAKLCVAQHTRGAKWVVFDDGWGAWRFPLNELGKMIKHYRDDV